MGISSARPGHIQVCLAHRPQLSYLNWGDWLRQTSVRTPRPEGIRPDFKLQGVFQYPWHSLKREDLRGNKLHDG